VVLLPYHEDLCSVLLKLREQVHTLGGKATLGKLTFLKEEDEREIVSEFIKQINAEYDEFIKNCQKLITEILNEKAQGDFNFSEIVENEEEYKKFQRWYDNLAKKNYFKSEQQGRALEILNKAQITLEEYSDEVYQRDENNH
jgi:hypothetical protein